MHDVSERRGTPQASTDEGFSHRSTFLRGRQRRLRWAGCLILITGLFVSAWLFMTATENAGDVVAYVMVDGESYPVMASDSKSYRHQIERFGGKMAVLADDLGRWIRRLTTGRGLAGLLALLSVVVAGACFRAAQLCAKPAEAETPTPRPDKRGDGL